MSGTHYDEEDPEESVALVEMRSPTPRRVRTTFAEAKGKGVQKSYRMKSPPPRIYSQSPTFVDAETFQMMMEEVLAGIQKQEKWIGKSREEVGLAVETLSETREKHGRPC